MDTSTIKKYFEVAEQIAIAGLEGLLRVYRRHLADSGIQLQEGRPYSFSLRAYNSHGPAAKSLFEKLSYQLTLTQALNEDRYGPQLHDFFGVALTDEEHLTKEALLNWPEYHSKNLFRDIFTYKLPQHRALYTLKSTEHHTDLCGFGYDRRGRKPNDMTLAFLTTSGLLEEYAHRF